MAESDWRIEDGWRVKTYKEGHCTITIRRPILTDDERKKREAQVCRTLAIFARNTGVYE